MSELGRQLVIIGEGEFAEIACEYFMHDSPYEVAAFSVESAYFKQSSLLGRPVVPLEELVRTYDPARYPVFVAITSTQLNRLRTRLLEQVTALGYTAVSYVSSKAFVWRNVQIGRNCFIFEGNVLQYHVRIGDNCILWSGNHIGHRSVIDDNCFLASHVVISGQCTIGKNAFLGVNSCVANDLKIADDSLISAGAVVLRDTEVGKIYIGNPARPSPISSYDSFNVPRELR